MRDSTTRKGYKLLLTNKLPNGSIASVEFSTVIEEQGADPDELFQRVYEKTLKDVKKVRQSDPIVDSGWKAVLSGIKQEKRFEKAKK